MIFQYKGKCRSKPVFNPFQGKAGVGIDMTDGVARRTVFPIALHFFDMAHNGDYQTISDIAENKSDKKFKTRAVSH